MSCISCAKRNCTSGRLLYSPAQSCSTDSRLVSRPSVKRQEMLTMRANRGHQNDNLFFLGADSHQQAETGQQNHQGCAALTDKG
jgi:hypothetical protein